MTVPSKRAGFLSSTGFDAASRSNVMIGAYRPAQRSADAALLEGREISDDRVRDQERNNGLVFTAVERRSDTAVGADLRPQLKPNWRVLGITQKQARDLAKTIEAEWSVYANDSDKMIDAGRRMPFGQQARVDYWHWVVDGRSATIPLWLPRYGSRFNTTFMLIDPRRVCNPDGRPESKFLRGGVELDRYGAPAAYHVKEQNPGDVLNGMENSYRWERIPAFTRFGRRRFIHGFWQRQAEQTQGRSPLLTVLKKSKMFGQRDDLELQAAAHIAAFGTFIKSEVPSEALFRMLGDAPTGSETLPDEQLANYMEFAADYYGRNSYIIDGTRVPHLLPNEDIGTVESSRAGTDFVGGQQHWMRDFGWALGMPYEQITGDFSKSAYVGMQAAFNEAWKATVPDRKVFADQTQTPKFVLWLEEAVDNGTITLPGGRSFDEARAALLDGIEWIGPGRGTVDPLKTANARRVLLETGIETLEQQLSEDGIDPEDHIEQLGLEEKMRRDAGLPSIFKNSTPPADPEAPDANAPEPPPEPGYEPPGAQT